MSEMLIAPRPRDLPEGAQSYRVIGPFDEKSLPAGLRRTHNLKHDCWGLLTLQSGSLVMVWEDDEGGREVLNAPASLVVPPLAEHHVEGDGPFTISIAFHRAAA